MTARNETVRNLPVVAGPVRSPARSAPLADARFAAQLLGREGERRGLRGGAPVLAAARSAYLQAQWSGRDDRRLPAGGLGAADM
jgi:hypothetical protein